MANENEELHLDNLESILCNDLDNKLSGLEILEDQKENIGNPDTLGKVVKDVIWEQFQNQIGVGSGEDFIIKNHGKTLDLRNSAHIQTTENFEKGRIATHNDEIDYKKRYDDWQENFKKDENGKIMTHKTRTGQDVATFKTKDEKGNKINVRESFDKGRPSGSKENKTDMDHTISAGTIIRDSEANAHLTKEEQIAFANSDANLNEIDSNLNRSKGDLDMEDWLDNPNKRGQKPSEIFEIDENYDKNLRNKKKEADKEYNQIKEKGKKRSKDSGKRSQKKEAFRIGKTALKAVVLQLLADLLKDIIVNIVKWFKSKNKKLKSLINILKDSIHDFILDLKNKLINAGKTLVTSIATAIIGPIVRTVTKAWLLLKQGWSSLKDSIAYLRSPDAKKKPFSLVMLEVGKRLIAGLTVVGVLTLGDTIEKGLMSIPVFTFEIPILGSLANILGIFLGALVSGIIGAIMLNLIDKLIAKKQKMEILKKELEKENNIINKQIQLIEIKDKKLNKSRYESIENISARHKDVTSIMLTVLEEQENNNKSVSDNLLEVIENHKQAKVSNNLSKNDEDDFDNLMNTIKNI